MSVEEAVEKAVREAIRESIGPHVDDLFNHEMKYILHNAIKDAINENLRSWHTHPEDVLREAITEAMKSENR